MNGHQYERGEVRIFEFQVTAMTAAPVVILSAVWELKNLGTVICRGNCDIDQDCISMLVPLHAAGDFTLEVRVEIPPETIIERMRVKVVE